MNKEVAVKSRMLLRYCALPACLLCGCSNSSSPPAVANDPTDTTPRVESLYGTWHSDCSNDGEGTTHRYAEWTFGSSEVIGTTYNYAQTDTECANPLDSVRRRYEVTYLADTQETSLGEAIKTDLIIIEAILTENGETVWDSNTDGIPADIDNEYQIFVVNNNRLYGGAFNSGDGLTPETRPTVIDTRSGLERQR